MTHRSLHVLVLGLITASYALRVDGRLTAGQTLFRSRTDAVVVDVTVRQGEVSVTDLVASEFQVLDNRVPQSVQLASPHEVPLDLWILTDTGGETSASHERARFPNHIRAVADLLRTGDQLAVLGIANPMQSFLPLSSASLASLPPMPLGNVPNILDGIADALLIPGVPGRRHLIIAQTTGIDDVSVTHATRLPMLAARSDAVLDLAYTASPPSTVMGALLETARSTGGSAFNANDIENAVRQALAALEHTYVLTYVATGVPHTGWHTITVRVTRPGTFTIGARRGYIDE